MQREIEEEQRRRRTRRRRREREGAGHWVCAPDVAWRVFCGRQQRHGGGDESGGECGSVLP
jgi:hypothetical protein